MLSDYLDLNICSLEFLGGLKYVVGLCVDNLLLGSAAEVLHLATRRVLPKGRACWERPRQVLEAGMGWSRLVRSLSLSWEGVPNLTGGSGTAFGKLGACWGEVVRC